MMEDLEITSAQDLAAIVLAVVNGKLQSMCLKCTARTELGDGLLAIHMANAHQHLKRCTGTYKVPKLTLYQDGFEVDMSGTIVEQVANAGKAVMAPGEADDAAYYCEGACGLLCVCVERWVWS